MYAVAHKGYSQHIVTIFIIFTVIRVLICLLYLVYANRISFLTIRRI